MSQRKNPIIVLEGIDGAGKGSQAVALTNWLIDQDRRAFYRHFPNYTTQTGKAIARHLNKEWASVGSDGEKDPVDETVFQCLMTVNRYEEAENILWTLKQGAVVCDRYIPSGKVYGVVNGVPADFLDRIHAALPQPDICILIDIPVEEALKRRKRELDRYEAQKDMQERVRAEYLRLFQHNGWHVVDGTGTADEVQSRIRQCIPVSMFF